MDRVCFKCKNSKPVSDFSKAKGAKDGLHTYCKECCKLLASDYRKTDRGKAVSRKWRQEKFVKTGYYKTDKWRDYLKDKGLQRKYGINLVQYKAMKMAQLNKCAICGIEEERLPKALHVDHNHITGSVRALLCGQCNQGLGLFNDSFERLEAAAHYLKSHL